MSSFTFAGYSSGDFGLGVTGFNVFQAPQKTHEKVSIPGRNGDIYLANKRFENISVTYPCYIAKDFDRNVEQLRNCLASVDGYARLTDSYHPEEYRLAVYSGGLQPSVQRHLRVATVDITFDCKPQRFLVSGEQIQAFTEPGTINNPTLYNAKPLIRVYGTGVLSIGTSAITITSAAGDYTDIDCEAMEAYYGATNCNPNISLVDYEFPELVPGSNGVTWSGSITQVDVTPRWWML